MGLPNEIPDMKFMALLRSTDKSIRQFDQSTYESMLPSLMVYVDNMLDLQLEI